MATIQDVVKLAGVSTATVSRVLNNSPRVLPETRKKVLDAIETLDYKPNRLARQFRTQTTGTVLVLLPRLITDFYSVILEGIESVAQKANYRVYIATTHNSEAIEKSYFDALSQKQVDGIITFSARLSKEYVNSFTLQYPVVVACRYLQGANFSSVTIDNTAASYQMTNYMIYLGHKHIVYLCGDPALPLYRSRLSGYRQAMEEHGLTPMERIVDNSEPSIDDGYAHISRMLLGGEEFTAVVASGDSLAVGAIKALQAHHLRVPDDVAVCGFDDINLASLITPTLTTIRQPRSMIGIRSMEKMIDRINNGPGDPEQIVLDHELVIRASSGKPLASAR